MGTFILVHHAPTLMIPSLESIENLVLRPLWDIFAHIETNFVLKKLAL